MTPPILRRIVLGCFVLGVVLAFLARGAEPLRLSEPWQSAYTGADAGGPQVIGLWQFSQGAQTKDSSPNKLDLKLQGAAVHEQGIFGPCIESFAGYPIDDKRHAAIIANSALLTPRGAFTIELWITPKPELAGYGEAFLVDKKYASQCDYQLTLSEADKAGQRRLIARLGFGDGFETYLSEAAKYESGTWHHVAFTYDGAGEVRFFRDGAALGGGSHPNRRAVTPGSHPLSIGDRVGSYYHGFPGYIAQVRLCNGVLEFRPVSVAMTSARTTFVRMEKTPLITLTVTNHLKTGLSGATLAASIDGLDERTTNLPQIDPGAACNVEYALDASLRPDDYKLHVRLAIPGATPYRSEETIPLTIVARPLPQRMPVVMWGIGGVENVLKELPRLKEIGFTHCLGLNTDYAAILAAGKPAPPGKEEEIAQARRMLNLALANDLGIIASLSPATALKGRSEFHRVGRDGKVRNPKKPDVCGLVGGATEFCRNVGASMAQTYGPFPAFRAALLNTEQRDGSDLCFHECDQAAYRLASGREIPPDVASKAGVRWEKLTGFPADRVIPDDHPILQYLRWYWKQGDGWNGLNNALHQGLKSTGRQDLWTFHDPAGRVAAVYGSGGAVDVISQWTYSYPDPIRIGLATDELLAMAGGADHPQQVMKMTQIIWYRSQTAPPRKTAASTTAAPQSPWEDTDPDAAFITIAPMHLREALWSKLSRPVQGIMYHGWQSLVPCEGATSYRYTNPQTQHELRRLIKQVVEPLGPALMQVPDRPADVAFLESFTSEMFAGRGTYGWGQTWAGDAYHVLQYAHLQPEVIYDQTVASRGLDRFKILVMADCDVLPRSVADAVKEFQRRGGIVIGDARLAPAIKPDVVMEVYERKHKAAEDRAALQAQAVKLGADLATRYQRYADSNNTDVVVRCRAYGSTDYLFAVNDLREAGDYVGQHGLVMENGLPSRATLSLRRAEGCVYDLTNARRVDVESKNGAISFVAELGPCDGNVYMATSQPIDGVQIDAPAQAKLGGALPLQIRVVDRQRRPIDAVIPMQVEIHDPSGRAMEFTGYYGAKDARLAIQVDLARNDAPGVWEIQVRELASGATAAGYVRVSKP